ncbi:hypothetical protein HW555_010968 [Spodoptera exigua]|uniref:Antennapedia n=1 Tax=Spodoptera exigua TaxID=7107 RepID=A0A835KZA8_SPOEX|nr:hypothetical protein HW555_010968 [Spodoptera exigua]
MLHQLLGNVEGMTAGQPHVDLETFEEESDEETPSVNTEQSISETDSFSVGPRGRESATEDTDASRAGCGPAMSANNCDSMTYFSNAYMPDMRNGGGHEHQQAHAHYGAVPQQGHEMEGCDQQLRPAQHHYPAQPAPGMPYPRFPPYDRLGYYQQMEQNGYRPDSPSQMGHMGPKTADGYGPNGHQPPAPAVYTSCKLQAAAATAGGVPGSPPLEQAQQMPHHMHPQQHMVQHGVPHQQHLMYPVDDMQHQTQMPPMHQQSMHAQQPPPQQPPPNTNASLPSPLYPWMRSQFADADPEQRPSSCATISYCF